MKFKITRSDGTIIEGEGTADDVLRLAPVPFTFVPYVPTPLPLTWPEPLPRITWEITSTAAPQG